ncbi:hypothetical protein [Stutzerimonas degradans]|uniref:Uncharacterized protein n=1 Tax=Stutzerimonas degradans TaxID=2968968 RepID=A0A8E2QCP5_9GAMM|nr:hypothetical protein [Stutzerimonas degradans]MCQ4275431.1 hypothetical protein [Stutzerimonas degradans]PNF76397.1 hypothetical protein CXK95_13440 [Stutzerimonas degradans]QPT22084.1 hypothetical protein I6G33_01995 [Stutzerimonas degradans]HEK0718892.1 hypothetical protein [Pseudomonas aeruginosa]
MTNEEIVKRLRELEGRVDRIEVRLDAVEQHVVSTLDQFGDYKNRTVEELVLMKGQIDGLVQSVESLILSAENTAAMERAKSLRRRLLNNQTRIEKNLKEKKKDG